MTSECTKQEEEAEAKSRKYVTNLADVYIVTFGEVKTNNLMIGKNQEDDWEK